MPRISRNGQGKTLYIQLSVYPCGTADPTRNLTISCPDKDTRFKTTLTDEGLRKFREVILSFYDQHILSANRGPSMGVVVREKVKGSGVWWVFIHHDKRRWSQRIGPRRDANAVASEVRRALAEGTFKRAENRKSMPTLQEYGEHWLDTYVRGSLKPKTQEDYRQVFKLHLFPALGHKRLDEISRADVKELVFAKQAAELAANTIRLIRAPLSRLFTMP